ncbi:Cofactor of BRCA1 [Mortierella sp. GBA30]|nr:Cofactor of BRCA1 [Mortierella sp. GBA30]
MEEKYLLGPRAVEKIRDMLAKQRPNEAISQIQERSGLNDSNTTMTGIQAIYPLLDHHGKSRYDVHSSCMRALKSKLLQKLETAQMDDARVDAALESMLPYIDVADLQELPLALLGRFPDKMTKEIISKIGSSDELFKVAPKEVKRRIWLSNPIKFRSDVIPIVKEYSSDPEIIRLAKEMSFEHPTKVITQRRSHPSIKQLLDIVGGNFDLYNHIGSYLRSLFIQTNEAVYCTLRFDLLMAMHEADLGSITKVDPCHELVWNLDACNRTLSMDERRVENIRKFFDRVNRDDPVHGDIAMILNDPFTSNMIASRLLVLLKNANEDGRVANSDPTLIWTATMLNLGSHARRIVQQQKFRIPKVEANVLDKFMTTMSNCILDDTLGQLKQDMDENVEYEEVKFTDDNLVALDDSEVARKSRKWQTVIINEFLMPCAAIDSSVHEQTIGFLLEAFRLVASSGRAGALGDVFLGLGRWIETLFVNRPVALITEDKNNELRGMYAKLVGEAGVLSGGRYRMRPEDIPNVMAYVQPVWGHQESRMDTSV